MTVTSKFRGHPTIFINDKELYEDTREPTKDNEKPCLHCGKESTKEGHDGCLGTIKGALNACCGHGEESEAYIQYEEG